MRARARKIYIITSSNDVMMCLFNFNFLLLYYALFVGGDRAQALNSTVLAISSEFVEEDSSF